MDVQRYHVEMRGAVEGIESMDEQRSLRNVTLLLRVVFPLCPNLYAIFVPHEATYPTGSARRTAQVAGPGL